MQRSESPAATPREISSRSASDSRQAVRGCGRGVLPPLALINRRMAFSDRSKVRLIDRIDSPV